MKATLWVWVIYGINWLSYRVNKDDGNRRTEAGDDNNPLAEEAEGWKRHSLQPDSLPATTTSERTSIYIYSYQDQTQS